MDIEDFPMGPLLVVYDGAPIEYVPEYKCSDFRFKLSEDLCRSADYELRAQQLHEPHHGMITNHMMNLVRLLDSLAVG